jgi:hypothetical protein
MLQLDSKLTSNGGHVPVCVVHWGNQNYLVFLGQTRQSGLEKPIVRVSYSFGLGSMVSNHAILMSDSQASNGSTKNDDCLRHVCGWRRCGRLVFCY